MNDDVILVSGNIVWGRPDGGISVDVPQIPGVDLEKWRDELIRRREKEEGFHSGWECLGINLPLPSRCEFRNAMAWDGQRVVHDMGRARDLRREQLRRERVPLLAALDIDYQRADEVGDAKAKAAIAVKKQALRDITESAALDKAATLDDLRAVKCPT